MQSVITFAIVRTIAFEVSCAPSRIMMYILRISLEGNCLFSVDQAQLLGQQDETYYILTDSGYKASYTIAGLSRLTPWNGLKKI